MYHVRVLKDNIVVEDHMLNEPLDQDKERELLDNREDHWIDVERVPLKPEDFIPEEEIYDADLDECE